MSTEDERTGRPSKFLSDLGKGDSLEPQLPHAFDLPSIAELRNIDASGWPLLLEPHLGKRNEEPDANAQLVPKHNHLIASIEHDAPFYETKQNEAVTNAGRALSGSSPQSLRKILEDSTQGTVGGPAALSKRHRIEPSKDGLRQLPPPKKQKTVETGPLPPTIPGLYEPPQPPPEDLRWPPIDLRSSFHDSHYRNTLNLVSPKAPDPDVNPKNNSSNNTIDKSAPDEIGEHDPKPQQKRRSTRPRRRWTQEQTNAILRGVNKHGIGNWTDILRDADFAHNFTDRTASDLKDRFRTACPEELLGKSPSRSSSHESAKSNMRELTNSGLMSETISIDNEESVSPARSADPEKSQKKRAHRQSLNDLTQLGIVEPFRQSTRRARRPFTEEEDVAILAAWRQLGPQWTRIQREPQYNLQSRQPTDLRDRFRNKFPNQLALGSKAKSKAVATEQSFNSQSSDPWAKSSLSNGQPSSYNPFLQGQEAESRPNEMWQVKEHLATSVPLLPTLASLHNRDSLRIPQITTSNQEVFKPFPFQQEGAMFGGFNPFIDQQAMDQQAMENAYSQGQDWEADIAAPFSTGFTTSRLPPDNWQDDIGQNGENNLNEMSGKERQSFTGINSILSGNETATAAPPGHINSVLSGYERPTPAQPSFVNMLNIDDEYADPHYV